MTIQEDTQSYDEWLGRFVELHAEDLAFKHRRMADTDDPFPFFRATYYRWRRRWPGECPEFDVCPRVLAVGDLHVENFGTWRDREGRLAWGINDFDEAFELPYANDLVRLACSVKFARKLGPLGIRTSAACEAILRGYRDSLQRGGRPFVLEEGNPSLRTLAYAQERDPGRFWKRITRLLSEPAVEAPEEAREAMLGDLPARGLECQFRFRPRIGMGSLGRPRYVLLATWSGGWIAREAKAVVPPASCWLEENSQLAANKMARIVKNAIRCHDPFFRPERNWMVRRIAPRCSRIELSLLDDAGDQTALLEAMGAETANVHLGSRRAVESILKDLDGRPSGWLKDAARRMHLALRADWQEWRSTFKRHDRAFEIS
jgi:hypothetical protein